MSLLDLIGNHARLTGFWLMNWLRRADPADVQAEYRELIALIADGTLSARVDRILPLRDYRKAFEGAFRAMTATARSCSPSTPRPNRSARPAPWR